MSAAVNHCQNAQHAAEEQLENLWRLEEEEGFCTCGTCVVREVLEAATPHLYKLFVDLVRSHGVEISPAIASALDD